jgi:hypothetical protein
MNRADNRTWGQKKYSFLSYWYCFNCDLRIIIFENSNLFERWKISILEIGSFLRPWSRSSKMVIIPIDFIVIYKANYGAWSWIIIIFKVFAVLQYFDELYGLMALSWQIVTIWMIQTTRDTSTQSNPWIAEQADFIGQIWKGSTDQMVGSRIFQ